MPITDGQVGTAVEVTPPTNALADNIGDQNAQLESVSCDPSGACIAVGSYTDDNSVVNTGKGNNTQAFVVPISGGSVGSAVEVAPPASNALGNATGNQDARLESVSCEASGACVAVGNYRDDVGSTTHTTGNREAMVVPVSSAGVLGTSTMLTLPTGANASSMATTPDAYLSEVSCPASGSCAAIGGYDDTNGDERMVASISSAGAAAQAAQVVVTLANVGKYSHVRANAVGCGSAGCDVVGTFRDANESTQPLVIPVGGSGASTVLGTEVQVTLPGDAVQDGTGQQEVWFGDISCPAAGACLATGGYKGVYQGENFGPGGEDYSDTNVNNLLVAIAGTSVGAGTSGPLPSDAAAYGRLSVGEDVGCGATGSCVVFADYLQGFSSSADLIGSFECLMEAPSPEDCLFGGTEQPYVISAQAPLTITPGAVATSVTSGVTSVSLASAATGGWSPYMWSVAAGNSLPAGLSLDPLTGVISGTPQAAGTYTLWVRADSPGVPAQNAEASLTLTVSAPTPTTPATVTSSVVTSSTTGTISPAVVTKHEPSLIVVRGNLRDHDGTVKVHLRCHSWGRCTGSVKLTWHGHVISRVSHLSIPAGQTRWVTVHLNARGMKDAASLRKPRHGYPTMYVRVVPKLTVGHGFAHGRPMWVI